ncbi:23S rRNA (pseudouridine(1915)-N(3))-methyltransferase RlmH [Heliorestis acidaminivorans]|uniref:Ribosomal RNA large subunit methyltransferase H n=1 Tax=Heliorestis acidaminivorans TaxID=553427 RepID=A0A6I0F8N4_9FIRM|nr:23S rRNA (pseudouridine(1915)-N(3))-methyltransferase RlmH [Heliorestis acidaminivorans]KAB2953848.1 23S rRNA (pseudouridine(1915)-N(3))-methyltransferase RlmH [Heliorestis acidaminivorans]
MQIQIISVGKIKEKYLKLGIEEFSKRLSVYCRLTHIEVSDEEAPDSMSAKEIEQVKEKEGERILQQIKADHYVIALAIDGVSWSSEELAKEMDRLATYGQSQLAFVIGGSNGLSDKVMQRANKKLSFSKMTFPHQLMKLILVEQIYRAFRINRGEPYHK